ncbi:MAG TPA: SpoIIE family protein phosphatase [Candidatus Acidoferrales bacterium]|nr:SpoIIE family protein phosphatase [Candidatus Acidoferrales bacterium]
MNLRLTTTQLGETRTWTLDLSPTRAGRSSSNGIQLLDGTVSKEHAEFLLDGARWMIRDLGSRNGTKVNGAEITGPAPIQPGDTLEIGHVILRVSGETTSAILSDHRGLGSSLKLKVVDLLQQSTGPGLETGRMVHLLAEAGQLLVLPRPLPETCETLLGFVERAITANRLVMLLRERPGAELVQIAARARGASLREPLALSQSIVRTVLEENTAVITADAMNDPRFLGQQSIIAQAIHSAMAVPLWDNASVLGILYVDSTSPAVIYAQPQLELLTLLGNMAAVKITNARLLEAEQLRQRLAQELATATRIQQSLLPGRPNDVSGWRFLARIETCHEVGGDLYDFHRREDGAFVFMVGDVSGKGMGAALLMSSVLSSSRVLYDACDGPLQFVRKLNAVTFRSTDARSFVTIFVGWLDPTNGRLRYVNAGHPEACLVHEGKVRGLGATGIPVGMLPDFPWTEGETTLEPGELLAVFSDGIPEAQRGAEFFEMDRVRETLRASASPDIDSTADRLISAIDEFAAGEHRADDVTVLLVHRD